MVERITILIEERGINSAQMLNELKLARGAMSEWKKGKAKPGTEAIIKIADYFGVSTDYLLGRTDVKEPVNQKEPHGRLTENEKELLKMKKYKIIFTDKTGTQNPIFESVTKINYENATSFSDPEMSNTYGNITDVAIANHSFDLNCSYKFYSSENLIGTYDSTSSNVFSIQVVLTEDSSKAGIIPSDELNISYTVETPKNQKKIA